MTHLTITEHDSQANRVKITLNQGQYEATLSHPLSEEEQARLDWYYEKYLRFPYTKQVVAAEAAASLTRYGTALFEQLFTGKLYGQYFAARQQHGLSGFEVEVVGSAEFQRHYWEALYDPELGQFIAHHAPFSRRAPAALAMNISLRPSPTLKVLVVVARPYDNQDVGYRTISRPLVETLSEARLPVQLDFVRPGSYEALVKHLESTRQQHGAGYYHVLHFDLHGAVLSYAEFQRLEQKSPPLAQTFQLYGRAPLQPYEGDKAFLFFEGEGLVDWAVDAATIAKLMQSHQVATVILNACQAGQFGQNEESLAIRLQQAGVPAVVAMRYTVYVVTAKRLMQALYQQWFQHGQLTQAVQWARQQLAHDKTRQVAGVAVSFEDWLLPLLYQTNASPWQPLPFATPQEEAAFYARQQLVYPEQPFFGRDRDVLQLEKRLWQQGLVVMTGLGGQGKSSLLRHVTRWWQLTGWIKQAFYFSYETKAWQLPQILEQLARQLYGEHPSPKYIEWQQLPETTRQSRLVQALRSGRYLLMLDNGESITGNYLAIRHTLTAAEQAALAQFLQQVRGGQTFILCASRDDMAWLKPTRAQQYALRGLDEEARQALVEGLLLGLGLRPFRHYWPDPAFQRLLQLLDGHPLAMQVVLSKLVDRSPAEIVAALQAGQVGELDIPSPVDTPSPPTPLPGGEGNQANSPRPLGEGSGVRANPVGEGNQTNSPRPLGEGAGVRAGDKTQSILACIEYAYHDIDPQDQTLLMCLAPFQGVMGINPPGFKPTFLEHYIKYLQQQPDLANLPFARLPALLQHAQQRGLLQPHEQLPGYFTLQPIFPYFLRSRLTTVTGQPQGLPLQITPTPTVGAGLVPAPTEQPQGLPLQAAINTAFRQHYDNLGDALVKLLESKNPGEKQAGFILTGMEYENLYHALMLALAAQVSILNPYLTLILYLNATQDRARGLKLGQEVMHHLEQYPASAKQGQLGAELVMVLDDIANRYLELKKYTEAEQAYQQCLTMIKGLKDLAADTRQNYLAIIYHSLGRVAKEQRQWVQAEGYCQQALQIFIEFNDRYKQAGIYHQLGRVAQAQRQWAQAEGYYQQALQIRIEFNDRYEQAKSYHQLGRVAQAQRQWAQAEGYYQQALQIFVEFNDRYPQATVYHQLGRVAQKQQQWAQAEGYYQQALQIFIEFNDRYPQATVYHQLGYVAQEQRQWAQAEGYYQQALQLFIEFNDRYNQANTYGQLGLLAEAQAQWAQAVAYLLQAREIFAAYQDEHNLGVVMDSLRRVLVAAGEGSPLWGQVGELGIRGRLQRIEEGTDRGCHCIRLFLNPLLCWGSWCRGRLQRIEEGTDRGCHCICLFLN